jgi:hypothetical protein
MAFKAITDDIIVQEGTFAYSFEASGTIYGGQLVKPAGPMQVVYATADTDNAIGVAAYYVTKGEAVAVYGPGNIVRCHGGHAISCGDDLFASSNGCIDMTDTYGGTAPCIGIAMEATASGAIRVLLK